MISATGSRARESRARGLTLVELLVSVAMLSFGAVLIAQALARIAQAQAVGERYDQAYLFLLSKMADVELAMRTEGSLAEREQGSFRVDTQAYRWMLSAQPVAEEVPDLHAVAMIVSWDYAGQPYHRQVDTLFHIPSPPQ